jgi:hypothetical protein
MEEQTRQARWTERPGLWLGALFVVVALATFGFQNMPGTIGALDERLFHLPTVREFAATWPSVDFRNYHAATGPTYHYLLAPIAKATGYNIAVLRAVTGVLSMLAAWLVASLLQRFAGWRAADATAGAVLFALAPYTFGSAFVLGTDNPALLFTLAAMYALLAFRETPNPAAAGGIAIATALALTTRQTSIWLVPVGLAIVATTKGSRSMRSIAAFLIVLSALPLIWLIHVWGGPVPPAFRAENISASAGSLQELTLVFGLVAMYSGILAPRTTARRFVVTVRSRWAAAVALGVLALAMWGRIDASNVGEASTVDGLLVEIASFTPAVLGMSALFWVLIPIGLARTVADVRSSPRLWPIFLAPVFLGLCYFRSEIQLQRYCDGLVVLAVLAALPPSRRPLSRRPGFWLLASFFLAFAVLKATLFAGEAVG